MRLLRSAFAAALACAAIFMSGAAYPAALSPLSLQTISNNGVPVRGAQLFFFEAGTTTPKPVYTDASLGPSHPRPVVVNGAGRVPPVYVGPGSYRVQIRDARGAILEDIDGIQGEVIATEDPGGGGPTDETSVLQTGEIFAKYGKGVRAGAVRLNGRTIGNAVSGATERANADTQALFIHLWDSDPNLTVTGGRGSSALADFNAGKTLALPDAAGRGLIGLDDMGAGAKNRLAGGTFVTGNATTLGATIGTASEQLTLAQIPAHSHGVAMLAAGAHNHSGATTATGGHSHAGYTDAQGAHNHGGATGAAGAHSHTYDKATGAAPELGTGVTGAAGFNSHTNDSTTSVGNHSHSIAVDGTHAHNVTTYAVGDHAHGIGWDGSHTHQLTENSMGGGQAHNNLSPGLLITLYMKL